MVPAFFLKRKADDKLKDEAPRATPQLAYKKRADPPEHFPCYHVWSLEGRACDELIIEGSTAISVLCPIGEHLCSRWERLHSVENLVA